MKDAPGRKLVLVVDDDRYICEYLGFVFEKQGYHVASAFDGADALKVVHAEKVDLIVLDWMMPVLSGFQVIKKLQESEDRKIPVIVISAHVADKETAEKIRQEINVADFMPKPIDRALLLRRAEEIIGPAPKES